MEAKGFVKRRTGLRPLFALLTGVAVLSTLLLAYAVAIAPRPPANLVGPTRVASVTVAPENPAAGQSIVVRAVVAGTVVSPLTVMVQYASYFGVVSAGGGTMFPLGDRAYELVLPETFPGGTELWLLVAVSAPGMDPVLSDSITIEIGSVPRGGPSGLRITDVTHTPTEPLAFEPVTVEAVVTSTAPIAEVDAAYMSFCRQQGRTIDPPMSPVAPTRFTITIHPTDLCGSQTGTLLVYRVLAVDSTGNTAVSEPTTVRIR